MLTSHSHMRRLNDMDSSSHIKAVTRDKLRQILRGFHPQPSSGVRNLHPLSAFISVEMTKVPVNHAPPPQVGRKYRTIDELLEAPNLDMPPPINPRVEMDQEPAQQEGPVDGSAVGQTNAVEEPTVAAGVEIGLVGKMGAAVPEPVGKQDGNGHVSEPGSNLRSVEMAQPARRGPEQVQDDGLPPGQTVQELPPAVEEIGSERAVEDVPESPENVRYSECSGCRLRAPESELLLCSRCHEGHHSVCEKPLFCPVLNGHWICSRCTGPSHAPSLWQHMPNPEDLPEPESSKWLVVRRTRTIKELYRSPNLPMPPPIPRTAETNEVPDNGPVQEPPTVEEEDVSESFDPDRDNLMDEVNASDIVCSQCGLGDQEAELLLCDVCNKGYHTKCARPIVPRVPNGGWLCSECSGRPQAPSLSESDIINFCRIQDFNTETEGNRSNVKTRKRGKISTPWGHKSRKEWLPYVPSKDKSKRLEQLGSLAKALVSLKLSFADDLLYSPDMAPRSANNAALDKSEVQILQKSNMEIWNLSKAMHQRGECPPLKVVYDSEQGFIVLADGPIEDKTFICEYTGFVDFSKNRELDDSNSSMDLLVTNDKSEDLVICQDTCGNVSHFLSGINNHNRDSKRKQNCTFIRYNVDGECRIFIVSTRRIKPGTALYCNYNGGVAVNAFPTQNFV